jgi:hypothetical protein
VRRRQRAAPHQRGEQHRPEHEREERWRLERHGGAHPQAGQERAREKQQRQDDSLAVIFGSALVLKFVILASLSGPAGSRTTRVMVALFDAATFGTMTQEAQSPGAGYAAFAAVALFLVGIAALPSARPLSAGTSLQPLGPR